MASARHEDVGVRILAIRGENLASLAGPFELDLEAPPLASTGLFVISGPTGAGKSTLLDAVCLALYGALPRLRDAGTDVVDAEDEALRANNPRSILRHGAGAGYAEVEFLGRDRIRYRARWSVRRARGRAGGALQQDQMLVEDVSRGEILADKKQESAPLLVERIGLSFEQFQRSALLAQGEFDAFIRASASERALLLERVTGAEIFSKLSITAYEREAATRAEFEAAEADLALQPPMARAERAAALARRSAAERDLAGLAQRRASLQAALDWRRERDRRTAAAADRRSEAEAADKRLRAAAREAVVGLASLTKTLGGARDEAAAWRAENQAAIDLAARRDDVGRALGVYDAAGELARRQAAELDRLSARRAALDGEIEAAMATVDAATREQAAAAAALEERRAAHAAFDEASLSRRAERLGDMAERTREAAAAVAASEEIAAERARALESRETAAAEAAGARAAQQELARRTPRVQAEVAAAREAVERWSAAASQAADRLRALLRDGEPCPVCGARDHAVSELDAATSAELTRLRAEAERASAAMRDVAAREAVEKARVEERDGAARQAEETLKRSAAAAARQAGRWRDAGAALLGLAAEEAAAALRGPIAALAELDGPSDEAVAAVEAAVSAARREARAALDGAAAARSAIEAAATLREERLQAERAARAALDARKGEREALQAARAEAERERDKAAHQRAAAAGELDRWLAPAWPQWRERDVEQARRDVEALAREVETREAARLSLDADLERLEQERRQVAEMTPADIAGAPDAQAVATDVETDSAPREQATALRQRVATARDQRIAADRLAAAAAEDRDAWAAEPPEGAEAASEEELRELIESLETAQTARDQARSDLDRDDQLRAVRAQRLRRWRACRREHRLWKPLKEMIGSKDGHKFRNIAQAHSLRALVAAANARLVDLHPRYRLVAPAADSGALTLAVVDRDMADAVRGTHNLSGGERFLISLALALGLAGLSSERGAEVSTLFIDEGFGALDGDSLSMAISALEALQATGRRIGVISHVDALKERIAVRVEVAPMGGGVSGLSVVCD